MAVLLKVNKATGDSMEIPESDSKFVAELVFLSALLGQPNLIDLLRKPEGYDSLAFKYHLLEKSAIATNKSPLTEVAGIAKKRIQEAFPRAFSATHGNLWEIQVCLPSRGRDGKWRDIMSGWGHLGCENETESDAWIAAEEWLTHYEYLPMLTPVI